jgi:hypothetical protein
MWTGRSDHPPPVELQQLLDAVSNGQSVNLYIPP